MERDLEIGSSRFQDSLFWFSTKDIPKKVAPIVETRRMFLLLLGGEGGRFFKLKSPPPTSRANCFVEKASARYFTPMFITVQNHIIQSSAIHHIELDSPKLRIHMAGRDALEINYSGKADAVSAFKRIAGALSAEDTELGAL